MNKATPLLVAGALLATTAVGLAEKVESDIDGATAGKWTMDLDAAKKLAGEKNLPILLDFSGTDWCIWCKIMEENVFTKPEWATYAKDNLVMVLVDFPTDKSLVPEKYVARNEALKAEYGVKGYPTFVVLDSDGKTELGRLSSGRDKTPASFQAELEVLFSKPEADAKYFAALTPEAQAEFTVINDKIAAAKASKKVVDAEVAAVRLKAKELAASIGKLEEELLTFRVSQLDEAAQKEFSELQDALAAKEKELADWLKTKPGRTEENTAIYSAFQAEVKAINAKLDLY